MKYPTIELNDDDYVTYSSSPPTVLNEDEWMEIINKYFNDGNRDMAMEYVYCAAFLYGTRTSPRAIIMITGA